MNQQYPLHNFLKQYGARRTGTNFLRLLITKNVEDVSILMHVLGDKHSPPVDLAAIWAKCTECSEPETEFVRRATVEAPAETTDLLHPEQAAHLASIAAAVAAVFHQGRLGFLISVKDPYAWAASIGKHRGWLPSSPYNFSRDRRAAELLQNECREFNRCYRLWLDHHHKLEAHSMVVRFEEVFEHPAEVLESLCCKFGLIQTPGVPLVPPGIVGPAFWDHTTSTVHSGAFPTEFYREKRYRNRLSPRLQDVVAAHIDWSLMTPLGYRREPH